ncbi:hypothetical protein E4U60_006392 [Claviceps pazoutovae]|uniref:Protein kinase domain-containing protein n=1 Tax=Claviceps pazoutovae TaxID=1649127 RepID=A0A9P7M6W0_9HYPO|nr:hypothetical protein E4U60_006392 [Claviceps pazoutovae]
MADSTPLNKDLFLDGIERGIRHLHSLGIVHNDIHPDNVMLDEMDGPVIIDFDSWGKEGQELGPGMKKGTSEWSTNGSLYDYALFENDIFGLSKLREFIYDPSSGKLISKSTSANSSQTSTSSSSQPRRATVPKTCPMRLEQLRSHPSRETDRHCQNTITPPPPKEKEKQYKFWAWGKIKEQADKQMAEPRKQPERQRMLM